LPRVALAPLAKLLNQYETAARRWTAEPVTDTGPILRLAGNNLTKQERYANPTARPVYASGLVPNALEEMVVAYFQRAYQNVVPRQDWTWGEIKAWNKQLRIAEKFKI